MLNEFIVARGLDNLMMSFISLRALVDSVSGACPPVLDAAVHSELCSQAMRNPTPSATRSRRALSHCVCEMIKLGVF